MANFRSKMPKRKDMKVFRRSAMSTKKINTVNSGANQLGGRRF